MWSSFQTRLDLNRFKSKFTSTPNLAPEAGKAADDDVWGWDGSGAHVLQADDGRTRKCVGHFKCRSAMKGLSKKGRIRGREEEVIGFANATGQGNVNIFVQ